MPPRKTPSQMLMDSLLEMGIDSLRDTIQSAFSVDQAFQAQPAGMPRLHCNGPGCGSGTQSVCMSCKRPYCQRHSEWRRADGFVICHRCFQFLWTSGKEAAGRGSWDAFQRANGQYARTPMPPPVQPGPPPPHKHRLGHETRRRGRSSGSNQTPPKTRSRRRTARSLRVVTRMQYQLRNATLPRRRSSVHRQPTMPCYLR